MDITKIKLSRTNVHIEYTNEGDTYKYDSKDKPLKSFYDSMEALLPLILITLGLPKTYAGKKPKAEDKEAGLPLTPTGLTIATKGDSRLVCITATKVLALTPSPFNITVPLRYLDAPTEEGSCSEPYSAKEVELVEDVIGEAKKYLKGERAQGQLPLETEEQERSEPEDGSQEELLGTE
jgi:hypothetical protein